MPRGLGRCPLLDNFSLEKPAIGVKLQLLGLAGCPSQGTHVRYPMHKVSFHHQRDRTMVLHQYRFRPRTHSLRRWGFGGGFDRTDHLFWPALCQRLQDLGSCKQLIWERPSIVGMPCPFSSVSFSFCKYMYLQTSSHLNSNVVSRYFCHLRWPAELSE